MIYQDRPGRRVGSIQEVWDGVGGDYFLGPQRAAPAGLGVRSLWFRLPECHEPGVHRSVQTPCRIDDTWTITEEQDASVTVAPSIALQGRDGNGPIRNIWHGYLEHGKWRSIE